MSYCRDVSVGHPTGFRGKRPFDGQLSGEDELPLLAEWVRSRMAGSEHSTSKTPGLAERPVSGNLDDRNGHPAAGQPENLNGSKLA